MKTFLTSLAICSSFLSLIIPSMLAQTSTNESTLATNPVFQKNCAKCHGKTGEGRHFGGPSLRSEKATATPAEELANMIKNGKGRMPKYAGKLTPEEIDALVQQIKAGSRK